eukprot:549196-Rhodomonas_salina.3
MQADFAHLGLVSKDHLEAASGVAFSGPATPKTIENERTSQCTLCIETEYPYKICKADRKWLEVFGFQDKEIQGRALRMCQGPDTDMKTIQTLLTGSQKAAVRLTLYTKCGEPVSFSAVAGELEVNGSGGKFCPLNLDLAAAHEQSSEEEDDLDVPTVVLDADEPWEVLHVNSTFAEKFGLSADQIRREGVTSVFASSADGV